MIKAEIDHKHAIAIFTLDPRNSFGVCRELRIIDTPDAPPPCAKRYALHYQSIRITNERHNESSLIFEIAHVVGQSGQICSNPDTNDGPSLAAFVAGYKINQRTKVYSYELDNFPTIKEAINAKVKYLLGTGDK